MGGNLSLMALAGCLSHSSSISGVHGFGLDMVDKILSSAFALFFFDISTNTTFYRSKTEKGSLVLSLHWQRSLGYLSPCLRVSRSPAVSLYPDAVLVFVLYGLTSRFF